MVSCAGRRTVGFVHHDVVVLGAGPAGVYAAWKLAERGASVRVLEAGSTVGGMSASHIVGGQRVDLGSHRLHPAGGEMLLAELRSIGVQLQTRERNGRLRLAQRWVGFPLRAGDLVRSVPPGFAVRAAIDAVSGPLRRRDESNFDSAVRGRLGPTVNAQFYRPYAQKLWGMNPDDLDADLARRRVSASSPSAILGRIVHARRPEGRQFLYPRTGYGEIVERLADAATRAGATIDTGERVEAVEVASAGVSIRTPSSGYEATEVWSTIPVTTLARLRGIDTGTLRSRAMVLVYLVLDVDRYTTFDAHYVPDLATPVARLSEPKNYRDGDDPAGTTVLCAEVPCDVGDDVWTSDDGELAEMVADGIVRIGLPPVRPIAHDVIRLPSVYPVHDHDHRATFSRVLAELDEEDRILSLGRQGLFVPDNLHHVVAMASAAVSAWSGRTDRDRWTVLRAEFDDHVVED